jgi:hypothetical protein
VSVVDEYDPLELRRKHEAEYKKYSLEAKEATVKQPKFKLYLYDDSGHMVQEMLSLHDIQQMLLLKSKNIGLSQLKQRAAGGGGGRRCKRRRCQTI